KAIQCFERVLQLTHKIPDAQLELAVLYERRHRVSEALALIESCLREDPQYLEAELMKGRLLRRLNDAPGADAVFRKLTSSESAHPLVRAQAWTEIAQQLDREADYDGAMQAMLRGKEILQHDPNAAGLGRESEALQGHVRNLTDSLTVGHFRRWAEA